jgi:hypothetical protein
MLAYLDSNNNPKIWYGELVNEYTQQINVEQLWTQNELNAVGLYPIQPFQIPLGHQITSTTPTYTLEGEVVIETYQTQSIPIVTPVVKPIGTGANTIAS